MDLQNVSSLVIPEGNVRTIHDKNSRLLWGKLSYDTKYAGNVFQQTYSGKNLCDLGTKTIYQYELFSLSEPLPTGTYTFSAQVTSTVTQSSACFVRFMNGSSGVGAARISRSDERTYITVTTTNTTDGVYLYSGYNASDSAGETAVYTNIQIEAGSTATPYEPYVGGVPAPNPDYPQQINVATGIQAVTIGDGEISHNYVLGLGVIELCKAGNYQDYIYNNGTNWYIHKATEKINSYNGEIINTDYVSTTGQLTNGATIYYGITAPIDTQITDATLISQLGSIHKFLTRYGYNATVSGNLPLIISKTNL